MAGQTTWNKATVEAGTDPWNLVADQKKAIETSGLVFGVASVTERNGLAASAPGGVLPVGQTIVRTDTPDARAERWTGTAWANGLGINYTPIWTGVTDFGTGGSLTGTYWVSGDMVTVRSKAKFGTAATIGTGAIFCPLPTGLPIAGNQSGALGTGFHVNGSGVLRPLVVFAGSSTTASVWSSQFPVQTLGTAGCTAAANEYIEITISYQTSVPA